MDGTADDIALAERLTRIEESVKGLERHMDDCFQSLREDGIASLRVDLARFLDAQEKNTERLRALEMEQAQHCTAIATCSTSLGELKQDHGDRLDKLASRINTWGGGNSLAIAVGYLISFLRGI